MLACFLSLHRRGFGGRIKVLTCGGASLPQHLEDFYEAAGLPMLMGYGLTETSCVVAARHVNRNVRGTCGKPCACDVKIVDEQTGASLPPLSRGLIKVWLSDVL